MGSARTAGFRHLRATGWSIAFPVAALIGLGVGKASTPDIGLLVGSAVSCFGLLILALGYSLGGIWAGSWMVPLALASLPAAAATSVFNPHWGWAFVWTGVITLTLAIIVGLQRTANGNGGLPELLGNISASLVPGRYTS
jgi:hypothetical protein